LAKTAGVLVKQHHLSKEMIPSFSVPSSVSLPNATPIPSIPYSFPSFSTPRWVPIPTPLDELEMMQEPRVAPPQEAIEEKPKPSPKPTPQPQPALPPKPGIPVTPVVPEEVIEKPVVIEVPFIGEIPVPPQELLVTAGTTAAIAASVSVVAAMSATTVMNYLMKLSKPIIKFIMKRILKRKNKYTVNWARMQRSERLLHRRK